MKILQDSWKHGNFTEGRVDDPDDKLIPIHLNAGRSYGDAFPKDLNLILETNKQPVDFVKAGPIIAVSKKIKKNLDQLNVRAEYFKVKTFRKNIAHQEDDYYIFNLLDSSNCMNWELSVYTEFRGYAKSIKKITLSDILPDLHVFRVEKTIPCIICVSKEAGDKLEKEFCTGIELIPVETWKNRTYV